mgnify:CR=1 FL=1
MKKLIAAYFLASICGIVSLGVSIWFADNTGTLQRFLLSGGLLAVSGCGLYIILSGKLSESLTRDAPVSLTVLLKVLFAAAVVIGIYVYLRVNDLPEFRLIRVFFATTGVTYTLTLFYAVYLCLWSRKSD